MTPPLLVRDDPALVKPLHEILRLVSLVGVVPVTLMACNKTHGNYRVRLVRQAEGFVFEATDPTADDSMYFVNVELLPVDAGLRLIINDFPMLVLRVLAKADRERSRTAYMHDLAVATLRMTWTTLRTSIPDAHPMKSGRNPFLRPDEIT